MQQIREPQSGDILGGQYIVESELGRGGFGVVFKGRHTEIERVVAIKVMLKTYAQKDASAVDRFRREARIAASLSYPNTVRVFDYGETDEGVFYLVMEFLSGTSLESRLRKGGTLPPRLAVHIAKQMLYALSEAHVRGIVHRDIKPENVMLTPLAYDKHYVKMMDFGIAKMADSREDITQEGLTLGTPRYMPKEQIQGRDIDQRTDLYAVGLVLYEMLVGRPAIAGSAPVDIAMAILNSPSIRVPNDVLIPEDVIKVIEHAVAKAPDDRYQTADDFLAALDRLQLDATADADDRTQAVPTMSQGQANQAAVTQAVPVIDYTSAVSAVSPAASNRASSTVGSTPSLTPLYVLTGLSLLVSLAVAVKLFTM